MDEAEIVAASRREHALYEDLCAAYQTLAAGLDSACDASRLVDENRRAESTIEALRGLAAALAPYRMTGEPVPPAVQAVWKASAALAADAARLNATITGLVRTRGEAVSARLAEVRRGRRALRGYRPSAARDAASRCLA